MDGKANVITHYWTISKTVITFNFTLSQVTKADCAINVKFCVLYE